MNETKLFAPTRAHERTNIGQSALIIAALAAILGITGFVLFGYTGLLIALGLVVLLIFMNGRASPALLLKMYKAKPIPDTDLPELQQLFRRLMQNADIPHIPKLYYVPSKMMNAFAVGRGKESVVAVTHGLLKHMDNREISGVLAHELSHIKHKDLWVMGLADAFSRLTTSMGQIGQLMLLCSIPAVLLGKQAAVPWLVVIVLLVAPMSAALLQLALSRSREFEADFGAAQITGDPNGLASALRKIEEANTSWLQKALQPGKKVTAPAILRTHPPTDERIERLLALSGEELPDLVDLPTIEIKAPNPLHRIRRPRWHMMTGLWY